MVAERLHVTMLLVLSSLVAGCSALPELEGGRVILMSSSAEPRPAVDELAKIDIAYQLDPKKKGFCHRAVLKPDAPAATGAPGAEPTKKPMDPTTEIRCAMDDKSDR